MKIPDEKRAWAEDARQQLDAAVATLEEIAGKLRALDSELADDLAAAVVVVRQVSGELDPER